MPGDAVRKQIASRARRVVVKLGTAAICDEDGRPDPRIIGRLASQIAELMRRGISLSLVTSGAIGAGVGELNLPARPKTLPMLQASAAVGQGQLMRAFHDVFARRGVKVAQVLLTRDDFENRTRYLNIRNTMQALDACGALAIINENDAVAVDEIRFGDNDIIAALLGNMLGADLLVLLTRVDGVIRDGEVLDVIEQVDDELLSLVGGKSPLGSGGMTSKLQAATMVTRFGEIVAIANARTPRVLLRLLAGERVGTVFVPARRRTSSRRRWIGLASRPTGSIGIDAGAVEAVLKRGKSLLPSGIVSVTGQFERGDTVAVLDTEGKQIARGLTNYSAEQVRQIKGKRSSQIAKVLGDQPYDEVIHRDNMTIG